MKNKNNNLKNTLTDEALEAVNGGGSGTVPSEGITMYRYAVPKAGRYYCDSDMKNTAYAYDTPASGDMAVYTLENLRVTGETWSSDFISGPYSDMKEAFKAKFPYILNLIP